jgi:hypothetical protein
MYFIHWPLGNLTNKIMNENKIDKEGDIQWTYPPTQEHRQEAQQDTQQERHEVTYLEQKMQKFSYTYLQIHAEIGLNISDTSYVPSRNLKLQMKQGFY